VRCSWLALLSGASLEDQPAGVVKTSEVAGSCRCASRRVTSAGDSGMCTRIPSLSTLTTDANLLQPCTSHAAHDPPRALAGALAESTTSMRGQDACTARQPNPWRAPGPRSDAPGTPTTTSPDEIPAATTYGPRSPR
jgi:hypothetical protein